MMPSRKNVIWVGDGHRCDLGCIIPLKAGGWLSFFSWNRSSPWVGGFGLTIFWLHLSFPPDACILLESVILFILGHLGVLIIFLVIHGQDIRWGGTGSFSSVYGGFLDKSHLRVCRIDSFRDMFGYLVARDFSLAPSSPVPKDYFSFRWGFHGSVFYFFFFPFSFCFQFFFVSA